MDPNRNQPQGQSNQGNARSQQTSHQSWDGHDRRMGIPDRRQSSERPSRNTSADTRMMNEGSSR
jgi:hypothetical protein